MGLKKTVINHFLEFFFIGFLMGIAEDLITIKLATEAKITPHVIIVAAIVALPFAVLSELVIDYKRLKNARKRWLKKREKEMKDKKSEKTSSCYQKER